MPLLRLADDLPALREPVVVAALDGWIDAAAAASSALEAHADDADLVASVDPDSVYDYRSRRPVLDVVDGRLADLQWPELDLRVIRPGGGRDLLLLTGSEPHLRWQELAAEIAALCTRLGVVRWISLGAVPAAVPHTRAVPILMTASQDGLLRGDERAGPEGILRVPSAALSAFELAVSDVGIPAVGIYAQVPPYAAGGYAAASVALLDRLSDHLDVDLREEALVAEAEDQRERYDAATASDPALRETVAGLESMVGEDIDAGGLPSAEELAAEIQRYLREHRDDPQ